MLTITSEYSGKQMSSDKSNLEESGILIITPNSYFSPTKEKKKKEFTSGSCTTQKMKKVVIPH